MQVGGEESKPTSSTTTSSDSRIDRLEEKIKRLQDDRNQIVKGLESLESATKKSANEAKIYGETIRSLQDEKNQIVERIKSLESAKEKSANEAKIYGETIKSLESTKKKNKERIDNLEFVKNQNEERIKSLESAKEKSKKEAEIYGVRIKSLELAKEKIEKEAEISRDRIKSLEFSKEKSEKDAEIYKERIKSLESAKNKIEERVKNLEFVKNQNEERIKSLESAKEKSKKEVEIYGEKIKNLESAKEKIEKEAEIYRDRIKSLESAKEKSEKDAEIYKERIKSLESAKKKIEKEAEIYRERFKSLELEVYKERIKNLEYVKEKIEKEAEIYKERIKILEFAKEKSEKEEEIYRERIKSLESAKEKCNGFLLQLLESLCLAEERFVRIINNVVDEEKVENCTKESDGLELDGELKAVSEELMAVTKLAGVVELKVNEYKESRKKEKRELENSMVSLTEGNRNIDSLFRIALGDMEAVEKSLSRLKGNSEQNRVAIFQIAESSGTKVDTSRASAGTKLDGSESEEEVVSLASTVERITKNLNLEISQLRRCLEESRSNTEHLQSLTEKQVQDIAENMLYIKELEDREKKLAQNVEELLKKIKQTEAEVARWREACELEVEAGKREIEERDKVVAILSQELEKTKTALDISNHKLNQKEELAAAAMAARTAAEKSLQLADSTAAGLRKRVEELSKQLEEAESRDQNRRKARHIHWPRRALKPSTACMNNRVKNVRRMLPKCKKDAVKLSIATVNNRVKNVRRMLSKCKPWRVLKPSTAMKIE